MTGIRALEQNQTEQDLALSVHHAAAHTFSSTAVVKIIENNLGKANVRSVLQQLQIVPPPKLPQFRDLHHRLGRRRKKLKL